MQFRNILLFLAVSLVASAPVKAESETVEEPVKEEPSDLTKSFHSAVNKKVYKISSFFTSSAIEQISPSFVVASFVTGVGLVIAV
jgi:hypothetical protein